MKIRFLIFVFAVAGNAFADGDHSAPKGSLRTGPDKAVTAFDPEEGFKMSEGALEKLGVSFSPLNGAVPWTVPKSALVRIKHVTGVYRRVEGWISFVLVEATPKNSNDVSIRSEDLQSGDGIAVQGASFLRLTEADLNADTVDSCSH